MTARIDHYAKMLGALELAEKSTNADVSRNAALLAQVHATAYAAEQARIGNLIAYVAKWTDGEVLDVDAEIRDGLCLS
jgi:hypothetical protein